jgi:hypothetical protein
LRRTKEARTLLGLLTGLAYRLTLLTLLAALAILPIPCASEAEETAGTGLRITALRILLLGLLIFRWIRSAEGIRRRREWLRGI